MQIQDIMTPHVEVVCPDASLQEAARKMRSLDVGPLPVCDGDRLVGMLTDRDITLRAVAEGRDPQTTRVADVMTETVHYCFANDDVATAAEIMEQAQIRRLVVLNRDKRLVGIVSLGDLALRDTDPDDEGLDQEVLERVSEPA